MATKKSDAEGALEPLIEGDSLRSAFRRRRDEYDYLKALPRDEKVLTQNGWSVHKQTQSNVWMKREKGPEAVLEDRVWCLLYRMGYPRLSAPKFKIELKAGASGSESKSLSVVALDDETAIVVECRARQSRGRKNLQKDIDELEAAQRRISLAVRNSTSKSYNPKIVWLFATTNIIWTEKDVERSEAANVRIVTENELQYFEAFISHIGSAGRYQFLAEFLEGQEIPNLKNVRVPAVKGRFGAHTYYSFVVSARHLLKIAFVNHQALNHPDGRPAYQRMINKKRIGEIGQFIQNGGYFPTNIRLWLSMSGRARAMRGLEEIEKEFGKDKIAEAMNSRRGLGLTLKRSQSRCLMTPLLTINWCGLLFLINGNRKSISRGLKNFQRRFVLEESRRF